MVVRRALKTANYISQAGDHRKEACEFFIDHQNKKKKLIFFAVQKKRGSQLRLEASTRSFKTTKVKVEKTKQRKNEERLLCSCWNWYLARACISKSFNIELFEVSSANC